VGVSDDEGAAFAGWGFVVVDAVCGGAGGVGDVFVLADVFGRDVRRGLIVPGDVDGVGGV
jgi:hypothetical protein